MANTVVTKEQFRWILLECLIQVLVYFFTNMTGGMARGKYFNTEYMEDFKVPLDRYGKKVPQGGVPDCGNGRFADKLPFDDWCAYNAGNYAAHSSIWSIISQLLITIGLGIFLPKWGIAVGAILIAFRIIQNIAVRSSPGLLAITEPLNHAVLLGGLVVVGTISYSSTMKE